jgi:hypothetical protein
MLPPLGSMAATLQNMWINFFALSYRAPVKNPRIARIVTRGL